MFVYSVFYRLVLQKDNNTIIFLWQVWHTTVLKGLTYCLSEDSMRSSLGSPCPPGICPCLPFCDIVELVAPHEHFLDHMSSFTPCTPPPSPLTCGFLLATGWSINPSNPILPSRFIGLHTTKSPSTTGRGRSRRAQGLAFALELDLKPGESERCFTQLILQHLIKMSRDCQIIFVPLSRSYNINKLVEQAVEDVLRIG